MRFFRLVFAAVACVALSTPVSSVSIHHLSNHFKNSHSHQHVLDTQVADQHVMLSHVSVKPTCPAYDKQLPDNFAGNMCMLQPNWPLAASDKNGPGTNEKVLINTLQLEKKVEQDSFLSGAGKEFGSRFKNYIKDNVNTATNGKNKGADTAYTHFGVVVFEFTDGGDTKRYFCSAFNHREGSTAEFSNKANTKKNGHPWGDVHTERYCMDKFHNDVVKPWVAAKGKAAKLKMAFCTELVLCPGCVGKVKQFVEDMKAVGITFDDNITDVTGKHRQMCV